AKVAGTLRVPSLVPQLDAPQFQLRSTYIALWRWHAERACHGVFPCQAAARAVIFEGEIWDARLPRLTRSRSPFSALAGVARLPAEGVPGNVKSSCVRPGRATCTQRG